MGSKDRIAKYIIPIITKYLTEDKWYVEPFCGGCNMIDKINHKKRMANDYNKYLIALFKALQQDMEMPEFISKEQYDAVKSNKDDYEDWYVGFVGFVCSFRGKFFNGWIKPSCETKDGNTRNFQREHINNLVKQSRSLKSVRYFNMSYCDLDIPKNSIIYCDPPYQDTTAYKNADGFDHDSFWQWCREQTKRGCDVLISEYNAPVDFVCVWQKGVNMNLSGGKGKTAIEKLFVHESIADKYLDKTLLDF